jgi:ribose-phosphate pyrophosphokinase
MKVIYTEKSQLLAARVAHHLGCRTANVKYDTFPDGEQYVRVMDPDEDRIIVASTVDFQSIFQTILVLDACEGKNTTLILPYMSYARQDKKFHEGEPISARALARVLSDVADQIFTVNIHDTSVLGHFKCPAENLTIAQEVGKYIQTMKLEDPLILAPDGGAQEFVKDIATIGRWDYSHLDKTRLSGSEVMMMSKHLDAKGRDCIIVDDIISTGGSIATAAGLLKEEEATSVRAVGVHGVFASGGYVKLMQAGIADVASSDTIERACSKITASTIIADAVRR